MVESSYLTIRQKSTEKLKIQESEVMGVIQTLKIKILKSDLGLEQRSLIERQLSEIESQIKDYFAIECFNVKKIGLGI